ncbi:MAG TPA: hypothetical protein VMR45_05225 [Patescibacteria group bacterium]|nr:hypothetical protein [Patescibacteria group bacterium]
MTLITEAGTPLYDQASFDFWNTQLLEDRLGQDPADADRFNGRGHGEQQWSGGHASPNSNYDEWPDWQAGPRHRSVDQVNEEYPVIPDYVYIPEIDDPSYIRARVTLEGIRRALAEEAAAREGYYKQQSTEQQPPVANADHDNPPQAQTHHDTDSGRVDASSAETELPLPGDPEDSAYYRGKGAKVYRALHSEALRKADALALNIEEQQPRSLRRRIVGRAIGCLASLASVSTGAALFAVGVANLLH